MRKVQVWGWKGGSVKFHVKACLPPVPVCSKRSLYVEYVRHVSLSLHAMHLKVGQGAELESQAEGVWWCGCHMLVARGRGRKRCLRHRKAGRNGRQEGMCRGGGGGKKAEGLKGYRSVAQWKNGKYSQQHRQPCASSYGEPVPAHAMEGRKGQEQK